MKSQKVIRIELKHPQLIRVRKALRIVLKKAIIDKAQNLYKQGKFGKPDRLLGLISNSILQCGAGAECFSYKEMKKEGFDPKDRPIDLDMVWAPHFRRWFCVKCYDEFFRYYDHVDKQNDDDWDPLWDADWNPPDCK